VEAAARAGVEECEKRERVCVVGTSG